MCTAARNPAIASIVVLTTRPRCRLPDLSTWYAIRRVAACQVSTTRRKWADASHLDRLLFNIAVNDLGGKSALHERLLHRLSERSEEHTSELQSLAYLVC